MRHTTYRFLSLVVLVLPVWLVGSWLGIVPPVADTAFANLGVGTLVVILPVVAAGVLTIAALRSVQRDTTMSDAEKRKWRDFLFFATFIAAMLYFHGQSKAKGKEPPLNGDRPYGATSSRS